MTTNICSCIYRFRTNIRNSFLNTKYLNKEIKNNYMSLTIKHNISRYITEKLSEKKMQDRLLADKSGISRGQISKLKNGYVDRLSAETFYLIVTAFDDKIDKATKIIYPSLNLNLKKERNKTRNSFGKVMLQFETKINTLEQIALKTGISETRLTELYYRKGSPEAYELILIERAVGVKSGVIFEKLYKLP